jgi:hypothetical protein
MILLFLSLLVSTLGASRWVLELDDGIDPTKFAQEHHLHYEHPVIDHLYAFSSAHASREVGELKEKEGVKWAEEQIARKRYIRQAMEIDDPLYVAQWHLHGTPSSVDLEDSEVWERGRNVTLGIVDDGLEWRHPELLANYAGNLSWNFNEKTADPNPRNSRDGHGTSAAAVAVGRRLNGHCGQGVAPEARVAGIKLIAEPVTDLDEAMALSHHKDVIAIYSNSWGPADTGEGIDAPGRVTREVLSRNAAGGLGRNGKGSIYVWASGNGRDVGDSCAFDGYAGSPYVNAIGAIDFDGNQAWYSEGCSNLLAVAPSSGASHGITTADLMGPAGYDPGECTSNFGGTSSATPLAAGIFALLLEKKPTLSWRDLRQIVARGATQIDPSHPSWHTNDAGYHHSEIYGFGLLKIPALLRAIDGPMRPGGQQKQSFSPIIRPEQGSDSFRIHLNQTHISFIETAILRISLSHPLRGALRISLTSPSGTTSVLAQPRRADRSQNYPTDGWSFSSLHFWGETVADGLWVLNIEDTFYSQNSLQVHWFLLGVFGD